MITVADSWEDKQRDQELQNIFSEHKKQKQVDSNKQQNEDNQRNFLTRKSREILTILGVGISICLLFFLSAMVSAKDSPLKSPSPWAIGQRIESDEKIDGCIFRLWEIKKAIDLYYAYNKEFPETFEQLYEGKHLKLKTVCPASQKEYIFKNIQNKRVFSCPEPVMHNNDIVQIYCSISNSPPIIDRLGSYEEKGNE